MLRRQFRVDENASAILIEQEALIAAYRRAPKRRASAIQHHDRRHPHHPCATAVVRGRRSRRWMKALPSRAGATVAASNVKLSGRRFANPCASSVRPANAGTKRRSASTAISPLSARSSTPRLTAAKSPCIGTQRSKISGCSRSPRRCEAQFLAQHRPLRCTPSCHFARPNAAFEQQLRRWPPSRRALRIGESYDPLRRCGAIGSA